MAAQVQYVTSTAPPAVVLSPQAGQSIAAIATAPSRRAPPSLRTHRSCPNPNLA